MKGIYYLLIILAAVLWGSTGIFSTTISAVGITTGEMTVVRSFFATLIIGIFCLIKDKKIFKLEKITDLKYFIGMGIISYAFFNWCYIQAIEETSLGVAAILLYTAPSIIMILSVILFKEKITTKKIVVLIVTFIGCILVTGLNSGMEMISGKGLILGLCSGVGYALYSIFGKYALKKYSSMTAVFYMVLFSGVPFYLSTNPVTVVVKFTEHHMWGMGIGFALVALALPYLFYTKALEHVEPSRASILATLEPVVAAVFGIVLYQESISARKIIGIVLVLGAVAAMSLEKREK